MINAGVVLVFPKPDKAAQTVWSELLKANYFKETELTFDNHSIWQLRNEKKIYAVHSTKDGVFTDHLEDQIKTKLFIYISRHSASSGRPALLTHPTGNWVKKTLGGNDYELSYTSARALKIALESLQEMHDKYELVEHSVNIEVTHHGPTNLKTPLIFMELGSTPERWIEKLPAKAVGEAAIETAKVFLRGNKKFEVFIGLGGNHYAYRFHRFLIENNDAAIGHIAPKHLLSEINTSNISQAIEKTQEDVKLILIDKKGTKSDQRKKMIAIAEALGMETMLL